MRHAPTQPVTLHDRLVPGNPALCLVFGYGRFGIAPAQRRETRPIGAVVQKAQKFESQSMCRGKIHGLADGQCPECAFRLIATTCSD